MPDPSSKASWVTSAMRDRGSTIEILELLLRVDSAGLFPRSVQLFTSLGDLAAGASSHPVGRVYIEYVFGEQVTFSGIHGFGPLLFKV